jgi:uncharacterized membrane protein
MVLAAMRDDTYNVVLLLHIVAVLVAFAPAVVYPLLGNQLKQEGGAATQRLFGHLAANSRRIHFPALVVAGLLGIVLILLSDEVIEFSQTWVSLSFLVWIALCGVVSGMIMPGERAVAAGDASAERKVTLGGQIGTVLLLVMLYLMIFKPGF